MNSDVILTRVLDDGGATFGVLHLADKDSAPTDRMSAVSPLTRDGAAQPLCVTLENAWRDNEPRVSCIPEGEYSLHLIHESPKYGVVPKVLEVPGRSHILFHPGNLARHTLGCILPGTGFGVLEGQNAVLSSRAAFASAVDLLRQAFPGGMCRLLIRSA